MKKYIVAAALTAVIVLAGIGSVIPVGAESGSEKVEKRAMQLQEKLERVKKLDIDEDDLPRADAPHKNPSLFIGPQGKVRILAGTVSAVSGTTLTVEVWKVKLSVDIGSAKVKPEATATSSLAVAVNDKVSVQGTMNAETGIVKADQVFNHRASTEESNRLKERMRELIVRLREIQGKLGLSLTPLP